MTRDNEPDDAPGADAQRVAELQQYISRLRHEVSNPLAALLAEAQLLGLEPNLSADHRAAVQRIVDLVRRVTEIVRRDDEARGDVARKR